MKKLIMTAFIATVLSVSAFADGGKKTSTENGEKNVSYAVLSQFKLDFTNASNVVWAVTPNCQKVSFTENNIDYTAFYDPRGDEYWGLTHEVAYATIAADAKAKIAKDYKGYEVKDVIKFETADSKDPIVYFVNLKNETSEIVLTVKPDNSVTFFKKVK